MQRRLDRQEFVSRAALQRENARGNRLQEG